jgi:hypothetical protein
MDFSSTVASTSAFPHFADLPIELQLQIWEECLAGPSMQVFDVHFSTLSHDDEPQRSRTIRDDSRLKSSVFLGVANGADPSMYKHRQSIRQTSRFASLVSKPTWRDTNTVYLPERREVVRYDNGNDALLLRLRPAPPTPAPPVTDDDAKDDLLLRRSNVGALLDAPWTAEFAETLRAAKRIAFNATDLQGRPWCVGEAFDAMRLASCIQSGLEVLYFVHEPDVCMCGCQDWGTKKPQDNALRGKPRRALDVIRGMGRTYKEVRLKSKNRGWFIRYLDGAIRQQQRDAGMVTFKEVRFLVAVDD